MMVDNMSNINDSFVFKRTGHIARNRALLAAMTNKQSNDDGTISEDEISWLSRRAEGGFGIVTTAAMHVSRDGQGWDGEIGIFDDIHKPGLGILTGTLKSQGCISLAQIFHGGMRSPQRLTGKKPISASENKCTESYSGYSNSATENDIIRLIDNFSSAALRCAESGFDGIEIHGAHGYLISQFLGTKTNRRLDDWGGPLKNRSKLLIQIIRSIKLKCPENFLIGIRISPEIDKLGINIHDSVELVKILIKENIDFIHLSCWDSFSKSITEPEDPRLITEWFTSIADIPPIISTGAVWDNGDVKNLISQGADFIGVARVAIAHPDWPKNISKEGYYPHKPPFTSSHLSDVKLNDTFINYMRSWENFVFEDIEVKE